MVAFVALVGLCSGAAAQNLAFSLFDRYLDALRIQLGIPGLSAAIVLDGTIVWDKSYGFADVENTQPARIDTPYLVGDLTQIFTTMILAECAERGLVQKESPLRDFVPLAPDPPATLRQVLSHTSGNAGGFKYDLSRFALLTGVAEHCMTDSFRRVMAKEILERRSMADAAPGRDFAALTIDDEPMFDPVAQTKYRAVMQRLATPYKVDKRGRASRNDLPPSYLNAATGLVASVADLAKFDVALDSTCADHGRACNLLVSPKTLDEIWTNETINGVPVPTALGWFAQTYQGERVVWQFGLIPDAYSALYLRIPARRLTLILLANSDGLSTPFSLQDGNVTSSLFAQTFLRTFIQ